MDKETTTSVTIDRKTFARLDRLAKSNNVSKKEFLSCALEYFEKNSKRKPGFTLFFLLPYGVTAEYQPFKFFNRN